MKSNNGKIAITITAMFVIALSVIGVTYAYFTARIAGNSSEKSVEVTAGELVVNYVSSNLLKATNLVPGWKSDGLSYYDPESVSEGKIVAVKATDKSSIPTGITEADGLATPATFTVANAGDSTNTAYYAIKLTGITNGIADIGSNLDSENVKITVYKGSYEDYSTSNDTVVYSTNKLNASGEQIIVNEAQSIANGVTDSFYIMLEYDNATYDQSENMGKSITATIQVIGIAQNAAGNWVDAAGNIVIAA